MTYSEWSLVSLSPWPNEYFILVWILLAVGFLMVARSYRRSQARWLLTGLRTLMLIAVGVLVTQPTLQTQKVQKLPSRFPLLFDRSESMSLTWATVSRVEAAREWLRTMTNNSTMNLATTLEYFDLDGSISARI